MACLLLKVLFHLDVVPGTAAAVLPPKDKDKYLDNLIELLNQPTLKLELSLYFLLYEIKTFSYCQ